MLLRASVSFSLQNKEKTNMTSMLNQADQKVDSLVVRPIVEACGTVHLPGSKSISNRALLLAALADGTTRLEGLLKADDTERMIESLVKLGIKIERVDDETALVAGCGGKFPVRHAELFIGNAGTAARTLSAVLAFANGSYTIDGVARMRERPIADLIAALRELGAQITCTEREGFLPLEFRPASNLGSSVHVRGNVSSQYLTAILMVAPLIAPAQGLCISIKGELISRMWK